MNRHLSYKFDMKLMGTNALCNTYSNDINNLNINIEEQTSQDLYSFLKNVVGLCSFSSLLCNNVLIALEVCTTKQF